MGFSIGLKNESSLHSALKLYYANPEDKFEVELENYIIDIVRDNLLIEIQTKNFSAIGKKLRKLIKNNKVRLIHPIAVEKWITKISEDGEILSKRRSPKKGKIYNLFDELIRIPDIILDSNFSLEVLFIKQEELRIDDGKGSWRRKGVSIFDRKLISVEKHIVFYNNKDFLKLLPNDLNETFSNKELADKLKIPINTARKITYCMSRMDLIYKSGKEGNAILYKTR